MLEVRGLGVRYGAVTAVDKLDLTVLAGEIVVLVGANGSGKSSALNAIAGLVPAAAGRIFLDGKDVTVDHAADRVRRGMSLVVEGRGIFGPMTVRENLELGTYGRPELRGAHARKAALEQVLRLLPRLGERMGQGAGTLSGGEQQMLAIGRALVSGPRILVLDEPSLGLAPVVVAEISRTLRRLAADTGVAILVAEQNAALGLELASRGYVLCNGRVVAQGQCLDLLRDRDLIRHYLGGMAA